MFFRKLRKEIREFASKSIGKQRSLEERIKKIEASLQKLQAPPSPLPSPSESRTTAYLGNDTVLTQIHTGQMIFVSGRDTGIAPHLIVKGRWEEWVERVILQCLRPGMRAVDVGANHGYYTLQMASIVGQGGQIHAFEANPTIASLLARSIAVNGLGDLVQLIRKAAYSHPAELDFFVDMDFSGGGSLLSTSAMASFKVQADSLDHLIPDERPIDFIKIDAEGAEPWIIQGMTGILSRSKNISMVLEFSLSSIPASVEPLEYLGQFVDQGFTIRSILPAQVSQPLSPAELIARASSEGLLYMLLQRGETPHVD